MATELRNGHFEWLESQRWHSQVKDSRCVSRSQQLRREEPTNPLLSKDGWKLNDDRFAESELSASI